MISGLWLSYDLIMGWRYLAITWEMKQHVSFQSAVVIIMPPAIYSRYARGTEWRRAKAIAFCRRKKGKNADYRSEVPVVCLEARRHYLWRASRRHFCAEGHLRWGNKTTACRWPILPGSQSAYWAQANCYAYIFAVQNYLPEIALADLLQLRLLTAMLHYNMRLPNCRLSADA